MEIHRFEKAWLVASLLLIAGWIATIVYGAAVPGVAMVGDDGAQIADASDPTANEEFREPGVYCNDAGTECDVYVVAQQFLYRPDPIVVPAGSEVTFHVTSQDVMHGFQLVGTNVNTMVTPGQIAVLTVEFDDPAEYGVVCNEYCGGGHHTMAGMVEVVERSEYAADRDADAVEGES